MQLNQTPLHWATKREFFEAVKLLVSSMPYLDLRDECGRTALYIAAKKNNFEIFKVELL